MDSTPEELTIVVNDELSHLAYFLGYDAPPFDNENDRDDHFHIAFIGKVIYPEEFARLRAEIRFDLTKGDERKKWDKNAIIGIMTIGHQDCNATVHIGQDSLDRILQHYFLFREADTKHFHIRFQVRDVQVVEGKKWCRIYKLISGWGE